MSYWRKVDWSVWSALLRVMHTGEPCWKLAMGEDLGSRQDFHGGTMARWCWFFSMYSECSKSLHGCSFHTSLESPPDHGNRHCCPKLVAPLLSSGKYKRQVGSLLVSAGIMDDLCLGTLGLWVHFMPSNALKAIAQTSAMSQKHKELVSVYQHLEESPGLWHLHIPQACPDTEMLLQLVPTLLAGLLGHTESAQEQSMM